MIRTPALPDLDFLDIATVLANIYGRIPEGAPIRQDFDGHHHITLTTTAYGVAVQLAHTLDLDKLRPTTPRIIRWHGTRPVNDKHAVLRVEHVDISYGTLKGAAA